jgi:ACS family hexuronate transporter-like MFS transporter
MDKLGVKRGLPLFVFLWSVAATSHGLVGLIGVDEALRLRYPWFSFAEGALATATLVMPMTAAGFTLARVALGLSEGGNFPGAIKAVAEWFPVRERALATGWFNAGTNVGAIICPIGVPWLFAHIGWQATFYVTGVLGFVWVAVWWIVYDAPEKHPRLSPSEREYITSGQPIVEEKKASIPWLRLLSYRAVWAYIIASMLAGPAWGFYQFFLPDFLDKRFTLSLQATGWWTAAFFAVAAIGGILGGWLAGKLIDWGWTLNAARKVSMLICAIAVVPVFLAPMVDQVWLAALIVGIAGSAHQGWSANLYSVVSDTMPRECVSSVVGLGGFLCFFTGGFVNGITGKILDLSGSYVIVFAYFSGMYLISLFAIQLLVPRIGAVGGSE